MSELTVIRAETADVPVIAELVEEIERYYGGSVEGEMPDRVARLRSMLFGDHPAAFILLARLGSDVAGMATFSLLWPAAGDSPSLYLKELFVRETQRRRGVASALMAHLQEVANQLGCSRIEWTTDRDNPDAQKFYEALGVAPQDSKIFYRQAVSPVSTGTRRLGARTTYFTALVEEQRWTYETVCAQWQRAQEELAEKDGESRQATVALSRRTFDRWMKGELSEKGPRPDSARVLEHLFGMSVERLFGPAPEHIGEPGRQ